jgi:protein-disulfide isomerase
MSTTPRLTKRELRDQRRAVRESQEAAERAHDARRRRLTRLGVVTLGAVIVVAVAIVVSSGGAAKTPAAPGAAQQAASLVAGVPEKNGVLGSAKAKVTVTEYLDLQCPICKAASSQVVPGLVNDYVRTGKVKLQARTLHFIGADSTRAAQFAAGAQAQGRFWPFVEAFYASQGEENSGYVTEDFLEAVARAAGVKDMATWNRRRKSKAVREEATKTTESAEGKLGFHATPSFAIEGPKTDGLELLDTPESTEQLEEAISRAG